MKLFFGLLMVFGALALVGLVLGATDETAGDATDSANDVDEDLETWLVSPKQVPWLPDYSDDDKQP